MSKRVLIVENSLAVRGIAESLLRQNGYEVVAADSVNTAKSILSDTKIDLLLVASNITDGQGVRFYEYIGADASIAAIPLLVIHDAASGEDLPFPPEAIINKPFTPADFMTTIAAFTGGGATSPGAGNAPFEGSDFEDDIIDAALGLDKLDVADSEVIGNDTGVFRLHNKKTNTGSMIGYEFEDKLDDTTKVSKKIDEINVPMTASGKVPQQRAVPKPQKQNQSNEFLGNDTKKVKGGSSGSLTESSKIEIVTDQYGITMPEEAFEAESEDDVHDYNWFINELKGEGEGKTAPKLADSGSLNISATADSLSPQAPPPKSQPQQPAKQGEGVEQFISEFKKEMEKISDELEPPLPVTNIASATIHDSAADLQWSESLADAPNGEKRRFSQELIHAIAAEVAKKIIARIPEDKLLEIIKDAVDSEIRQRFKKSS